MTKKTKGKAGDTHLLIDADMLVYTMGYASEQKTTFFDGSSAKTGDIKLAVRLIKQQIKTYCTLLGTDQYSLILSGKGNWRTKFFPEYKANRVVLTKPVCYNEIREWFTQQKETILVNGEEADDFMAAAMTGSFGAIYISVTADKDFYTVPGRIYSLTAKRLFEPEVNQTLCFLIFQALNGDRVDGYYGVKWLGERKTARLLKACHGGTIRSAYLKIKKEVLKRGKENWHDFRRCLDLASLRWDSETGQKGIGLSRIYRHRHLPFEYWLPYYEVEHNLKYGKVIGGSAY
jgi:5'-3' exonuclease